MLKSMTGYGRGECSLYNRRIIVEIKSVNHRYNDISVKLPRLMGPLEEDIRKTAGTRIYRGKTDIYVSYETLSKDDIKLSFNEALADAYVKQLKEISARYDINDGINLSLISRFPDVITVDKNTDEEKTLNEIKESLKNALDAALDQFMEMRLKEGEALRSDILEKIENMKALADKVSKRAPFASQNYKNRLKQKLSEALEDVNYDESRLITEVTIFADKCCIDEEITRFYSHISQMEDILKEKDTIGRKLDFLVQEMNREVNTIGSKAGDLEITKVIVDLKSEVEKVREQVQNIE